MDVLRLIDDLRERELSVNSVVLTRYHSQPAASIFCEKLKRRGIRVYEHQATKGYPLDVNVIVSEEGYGQNSYIETTKPIVVVTGPGPGSGKLATCLSQLYHEAKRGNIAGYSKFETFPVWNVPLKHPLNVAYESATVDLKDVNMIDSFHMEAYNEVTVNYNRDIEAFPLLKRIIEKITNQPSIYRSPTDMGVNRVGYGIIDDEEIYRIKDELAKDGENHKIQDFEKENLKAEVEKVNFGKMKKYDEIEKIENNSNFENKDNKIGENINFDSKKENNNLNLESKSNFENINFKINKNIDFDSKNTKYNLNLKDKNDFNNEILEKNGTNKIVIERRIFRDGDNLERIIDERGQYAKTAVKVLKTYPEKNVTLVECELFTGRTHQIRVHLKSIGHTIVGDELYGNGLNKELGINRQFLHAYKVKFTHPASKEEVELEIPIFTDMKDFLEK